MLRCRPDRRAGRFLLFRHKRPDPDGARVLARRRRGASSCALHRARDHRPLAVRDDRQAGGRPARADGARGSGARRGRTSSSASAASTAATRTRSTFFHMAGLDYVSCSPFRGPDRARGRRPGGDHPRRRRPGPTRKNSVRLCEASRPPESLRAGQNGGMSAAVATSPPPSRRARPRGSRRWPRRPIPARRARPRSPTARCARRSSATATGSCTPRRSGGSSTRRRCSSRPRATTTARGSRTRSRSRRSRARSRARCGSTRTWSRRSGSGTISATRRSATSARRCSTRCLRERFGGGFRHNEHSLRRGRRLEGLNLTEPVRDGILRHSGGAGEPATLEGRIVRLVDRIAYINHDIDDAAAGRACSTGADLPAEEIAVLGDTGRRASTRSSTTSSSTPSAAGDIVQGERGRRRQCARCGRSCSTASTSARRRAPSTRKIERVLRTLFDHYCEHPAELPPTTAARRCRSASPTTWPA